MKKLQLILLLAGLIFLSQSTLAQNKFAIELRGGASFATEQLGDADLKTGLGFDAMLSYRFIPILGVYGGWGYNHFAADQSFAGENMDFEETGYIYGLEFTYPVSDPIDVYVRGGGLYNHIEIENSDGDIIYDSGHGFGWQAEAGVNINFLNDRFQIKPGVKYHSLSNEIDMGTEIVPVDLRYLNAGVGVVVRF